MGWFNGRAAEVNISDVYGQRFQVALARYERLIHHMASQHDVLGKESHEDLYQLGIQELWATVVSCVCEHPARIHMEGGCVQETRRTEPPVFPVFCRCTKLRHLDPLSTTFEKWFKTRLGHRLLDQVSLWKPRRADKKVSHTMPFSCLVRRSRRAVDTIPLDDVSSVMNVQWNTEWKEELLCLNYYEGIDFEIAEQPAGRVGIRWIREGPEVGAQYLVEGVQVTEETQRVPGLRDPRLEVHDVVWEQLGVSQAGWAFNVGAHHATPEERFFAGENRDLYEYFMERLTARLDPECEQLLKALATDMLNEQNGKHPERRLAKVLGWAARDLERVKANLQGHVRVVAKRMRSEGLEVQALASLVGDFK